MIPRIIHYCWFGKNEKSDLIKQCIESWNVHLCDYEIIEWNEATFDVENNVFVKEAYQQKKWAFVSDYVRAYALFEFGGIYLDTDVEIKKSFDVFLEHRAFSGFEEIGQPFTAVWGSTKKHNWPKLILEYYSNLNAFDDKTNTKIVSEILIEKYGVNPSIDTLQLLDDGIAIYPSNYFCLKLEPNFAVHHFVGSWLDISESQYNLKLVNKYYKNKYLENFNQATIIEELYNQKFFNKTDIIKFIWKKFTKKLKFMNFNLYFV
jgi:hypothetical protein